MVEHVIRRACAASTNGCQSALVYKANPKLIEQEFLELNGWWLDHGLWVCGLHEKKAN